MIVRESIQSFTRGGNSKSSLQIGRYHLIKQWLDEMDIENYIINDDLTVDVNGGVDLSKENLKEFPEFIQFNNIFGSFNCAENKLISLRGGPKYTKEYFYCDKNELESLEGCPKKVDSFFSCANNAKKFTEEDVRKLCNVKKRSLIFV